MREDTEALSERVLHFLSEILILDMDHRALSECRESLVGGLECQQKNLNLKPGQRTPGPEPFVGLAAVCDPTRSNRISCLFSSTPRTIPRTSCDTLETSASS